MREIKFRGLDTVYNTMTMNLQDDYIVGEWVADPRFVVMQFTGLKDKNGQDIYEGDIISVTYELFTNFGNTPTGRTTTSLYEVLWVKEGWGKKIITSSSFIVGSVSNMISVIAQMGEVIGNIYEHPHLLEVSK